MESSDRQSVVGIGELLWDCFADERRPGGAPANVVFHASQLGHRAHVASRVGDDTAGRELIAHLAGRGLATDLIQIDARRPTGRVTVDTRDVDDPRYVIHENVAWDALAFAPELERALAGAAAVCVGTLAQRSETSRRTIHRALRAARRALVVYDVNLRQSWYRREWIEATLARSRIVKLNLEEVGQLARLLETGPPEPVDFARTLIERGPAELVCVTRGADGCLLVSSSERHDVPGKPVRVADAVGAGDAFTAALISARLRGWPLARCGRFANDVGGLIATRAGAMPDVREELTRLVDRAGAERPD